MLRRFRSRLCTILRASSAVKVRLDFLPPSAPHRRKSSAVKVFTHGQWPEMSGPLGGFVRPVIPHAAAAVLPTWRSEPASPQAPKVSIAASRWTPDSPARCGRERRPALIRFPVDLVSYPLDYHNPVTIQSLFSTFVSRLGQVRLGLRIRFHSRCVSLGLHGTENFIDDSQVSVRVPPLIRVEPPTRRVLE